jgi:hypothetical protein
MATRGRGKKGRGGRAGPTANGGTKRKAGQAVSDDGDGGSVSDAPRYADTHVDSSERYDDVENWEKLVEQIDTIERADSGDLCVYMTM